MRAHPDLHPGSAASAYSGPPSGGSQSLGERPWYTVLLEQYGTQPGPSPRHCTGGRPPSVRSWQESGLVLTVPDLEANRSLLSGSGEGPVDFHRLRLVRAAATRTGRYLGEPADYQCQNGLENVVISDSWQFLPQLPDVRVLSTVDPPVRAHPCRPVFFLQAGFQRVERGFAAGPGQGEIGDGPVDPGRHASLKPRVEDCPEERVGNPHLCRSLRGAACSQRSRRRVVAKGAADTSHYVCDRVHPAGMGGQAGDRILDQLIHYGKDQVVFAGEVPVDGGRIRAESTAQVRHAESIQALVVK